MNCNCNTQQEGTRKGLNIFCTKEEIDSIQLIQNKISCASQACSPDAIPDGVDETKAKWFIQSAIDSLASYRWLENEWWKEMKVNYNLPKDVNVWVDFDSMEFYIIEE